jgi:hypothetical protein
MGIRISSLSANALPYTGREQIPVVQNATTRAGTLSSFVNYLSGDFAFVNRPNTFIGSQTIQGNLSVLGNQTIQGNLSVQNTLSATMVQAVSARFDFVDIKQFESSGFDIRGNLNVLGRLSATDIVNFNSGLTARDAVLFDVNTSAPALEITQRGSGYSLLVEDEFNNTTPFAITNSGNVGVGTSTPNEKLTVFGNLSVSGTLSATMIEAVSSRITYLDIREYELSGFRATGPVIIETNSSDTTLRITQSGSGDVIRVEDEFNDTTPFIVKGDGNVGIGISSPTSKFYVRKSSAGVVNPDSNSIAVFEGIGNSHITILSPDTASGGVVIGSPADSFGSYLTWNHDNKALKLATASLGGFIQLLTDNETEAVRITSGANVGIGVSTPNELLTVAGNISAYGNIYAFNTLSTPTGDSTKWDNTYTSVNTLSSTWDRGYTGYNGLTALSANWQSTYTTMTANSGRWDSVYSLVCAQSANWNGSGVFDNSDTTILLTLSDAYDYIRLTNVSPITIQVPVASWTIGTPITFRRTTNAGAITLSAGNNVTINDNNATSVSSGETFVIKYIATNTWDFI